MHQMRGTPEPEPNNFMGFFVILIIFALALALGRLILFF